MAVHRGALLHKLPENRPNIVTHNQPHMGDAAQESNIRVRAVLGEDRLESLCNERFV